MDDRWTALASARDLLAADVPSTGSAADGGAEGPPRLHRLCDTAARGLRADGAAVSLHTEAGGLGVAAASGPLARTVDTLQATLGEGPTIDASAAGHPVLVPDLATVPAGRWPAFGPAAQTRGVAALFAFPLRVGAARLGTLSLHRCTPGALDGRQTALALAFSALAVEALLDAQAGHADAGTGTGEGSPDDLLDGQYVVYQAQGMTMVDLGVSLADALVRLRARAFADGRPLHEVARDVVDGRLRLEPDEP